MKVLVFSVGERDYGADITQVREVVRMRKVFPIPDVPDFVEGVIRLRGQILPLIHLGKKLGLSVESCKTQRIIITKIQDHWAGILVSKVFNVITLKPEEILSPEEMFKNNCYLQGVAKWEKRLVLLLDLTVLLKTDETASLQKVQGRIEIKKKTD